MYFCSQVLNPIGSNGVRIESKWLFHQCLSLFDDSLIPIISPQQFSLLFCSRCKGLDKSKCSSSCLRSLQKSGRSVTNIHQQLNKCRNASTVTQAFKIRKENISEIKPTFCIFNFANQNSEHLKKVIALIFDSLRQKLAEGQSLVICLELEGKIFSFAADSCDEKNEFEIRMVQCDLETLLEDFEYLGLRLSSTHSSCNVINRICNILTDMILNSSSGSNSFEKSLISCENSFRKILFSNNLSMLNSAYVLKLDRSENSITKTHLVLFEKGVPKINRRIISNITTYINEESLLDSTACAITSFFSTKSYSNFRSYSSLDTHLLNVHEKFNMYRTLPKMVNCYCSFIYSVQKFDQDPLIMTICYEDDEFEYYVFFTISKRIREFLTDEAFYEFLISFRSNFSENYPKNAEQIVYDLINWFKVAQMRKQVSARSFKYMREVAMLLFSNYNDIYAGNIFGFSISDVLFKYRCLQSFLKPEVFITKTPSEMRLHKISMKDLVQCIGKFPMMIIIVLGKSFTFIVRYRLSKDPSGDQNKLEIIEKNLQDLSDAFLGENHQDKRELIILENKAQFLKHSMISNLILSSKQKFPF